MISCISAPAQCRASMARKAPAAAPRTSDRRCAPPRRPGRASAGRSSRSRTSAERPGDIDDRLAGADPLPSGCTTSNSKLGAARGGHLGQPIQHQPRRGDHRPPQEHRVGHAHIAERCDHLARAIEIGVGPRGDSPRSGVAAAVRRPGHRRDYCAATAIVSRPEPRLQRLGDLEGEFERLLGIQPRVAERLIGCRDRPR